MDASHVRIYVNGELRQVPPDKALPEVLVYLGLPSQGLLIEHNGQALLPSEWQDARVQEGDRLELLRVVAGG